jgi:hypothetical protein
MVGVRVEKIHESHLSAFGWTLAERRGARVRLLAGAVCLTPRWSQRRPALEFMDGLGYTTIIEFAEPLARRRGSALDR